MAFIDSNAFAACSVCGCDAVGGGVCLVGVSGNETTPPDSTPSVGMVLTTGLSSRPP